MWMEKHPHVRGEDCPEQAVTNFFIETPPRAWGRPQAAIVNGISARNTPTCVGKTKKEKDSAYSVQKHPHVRGEDFSTASVWDTPSETPPRAWGRLRDTPDLACRLRNTPTCVGKTRQAKRVDRQLEKHPHVRGEDQILSLIAHFPGETPPRAWGRRSTLAPIKEIARNTPTCVGKTGDTVLLPDQAGKHPHVRGEDPGQETGLGQIVETPPRAWGRQYVCTKEGKENRNTPTCVGKTLRDYSLFLLSRQNNIETSSFSDTSCSPDNSMSWRFGSPMP